MPGQTILDRARAVVAAGIPVVPVQYRDPEKRPAFDLLPLAPHPKTGELKPSWKVFQTRVPTDDELVAMFGNGRKVNYAIVTGAISGVVSVDADSIDARAWCDAHLPPTPTVVQTGRELPDGTRGEQRYYRLPKGVAIGNKVKLKTPDGTLDLDVRGTGGYCVAPGSVHATGAIYRAVGEWPPNPATLPELPAHLFDQVVQTSLGTVPSEPRTHSTTTPTHTDYASVLERAKRYMASVPPAIEGQGGDAHTFMVAAKLARGFDLTDADALDLLREWNQTCVPPWSDADLSAKIDGARKYGDEPIGGRANRPNPHAPDAHFKRGTARPSTVVTDDGFALTDAGNAEAFTHLYGDRLRYDWSEQRWYRWRDPVWKPDTDAGVMRMARRSLRDRARAAINVADTARREVVLKHLTRSEHRSRLDSLVYLSRSEHPIADDGNGWDGDPWLLACSNGVVELKTGTFRPGRPDDRLRLSTNVPYDPAATCPRWLQFLHEVFDGDAAVMAFMQRAVGYSISGDVSEQVCFMATGKGSNGKSTMLDTLSHVFGDYAHTTPFSTFVRGLDAGSRAATPELADMVGRRFVQAVESDEQIRLNEARLKSLTGGDTVSARRLFGMPFTFRPVAKLWLAFNQKPRVLDTSFAFWRRVRLVEFTRTFTGSDADPHLVDTLRTEASGILAWAVAGTHAWLRDGLGTPLSVMDAADTWRQDADPLADFLSEAISYDDPDATIPASELFTHYVAWADLRKLAARERLTRTAFGTLMSDRVTKVRKPTGNVYCGVGRKSLHVGVESGGVTE